MQAVCLPPKIIIVQIMRKLFICHTFYRRAAGDCGKDVRDIQPSSEISFLHHCPRPLSPASHAQSPSDHLERQRPGQHLGSSELSLS